MKTPILLLCSILLISFAGAESYFYAGTSRIGMKDDAGRFSNSYLDHLGSSFHNKHLPFGQVITTQDERFGFTSKESDGNGLLYYGARYYDPELGRFTRIDPVEDDYPYQYVHNNPLAYTDPSGEITLKPNWGEDTWAKIGWAGKWIGRGFYIWDAIDLVHSYKERGLTGAVETGGQIAAWEALFRWPGPVMLVGGTLAWYKLTTDHFASLYEKGDTMDSLRAVGYTFTNDDVIDKHGLYKRHFATQLVERAKRGAPVSDVELSMIYSDEYTYEVTMDKIIRELDVIGTHADEGTMDSYGYQNAHNFINFINNFLFGNSEELNNLDAALFVQETGAESMGEYLNALGLSYTDVTVEADMPTEDERIPVPQE